MNPLLINLHGLVECYLHHIWQRELRRKPAMKHQAGGNLYQERQGFLGFAVFASWRETIIGKYGTFLCVSKLLDTS